jgi:hypothetical protein
MEFGYDMDPGVLVQGILDLVGVGLPRGQPQFSGYFS